MTHEEFVKHWVEVHAPLARACPGISRYTLTIIKTSSTRKDVAPIDVQVDGIAELWFKNQADFDAYQSSPATKRLRDDGATFIGREIDFVADRRNHGNRRLENRPGHDLFVEFPQVFDAAPAARHDEDIERFPSFVRRAQLVDRGRDFERGAGALHPHRIYQHFDAGCAPLQNIENILDGRPAG